MRLKIRKMYINPVLLKGSYASKVVGEVPDTTMVLMDGKVKSHRLVLASNPFLHQLIKSSWIPGEISTFLMPQHSVKDLILEISLPVEIEKEVLGESERIFYETCEEEKPQFSSSDSEETNENFGVIKSEDIMTSDFQNATLQKRHRPESPVASSPSGKLRKKDIEVEVDRKSDNCEFTAKDISEDKLIVEMFGKEADKMDVNLDETLTSEAARSVAKMHTGEKSNQCTMRLSIELENFQILKSKGLVFAQF